MAKVRTALGLPVCVAAVAAAVLAALAVDGDASAEEPQQTDMVSHDDFVKNLQEAKFADQKKRPGAKVRDEEAFNAMKAHLQKRHKGLKVVHSFVDAAGNHYDCVPANQQPALRDPRLKGHKVQLAPPKELAQAKVKFDFKDFAAIAKGQKFPKEMPKFEPLFGKGKKDKHGNEMAAPAGTVALYRVTLQHLARFATLDDYLNAASKNPALEPKGKVKGKKTALGDLLDGVFHCADPMPGGGGGAPVARAAQGEQITDNQGCSGYTFFWPVNPAPGRESTNHILLTDGNNKEIVCFGAHSYPNLYNGDASLHFYVLLSTDAGATMRLNQDTGFVSVPKVEGIVGGPVGNVAPVTIFGPPHAPTTLEMVRDQVKGNWWVFLTVANQSKTAVGYFPAEYFTPDGLGKGAKKFYCGGLVAGDKDLGPMGCGQAPPNYSIQAGDVFPRISGWTCQLYDGALTPAPASLTRLQINRENYNSIVSNNILAYGGTGDPK